MEEHSIAGGECWAEIGGFKISAWEDGEILLTGHSHDMGLENPTCGVVVPKQGSEGLGKRD